jgi:hypothetical protein
MTARQVKTEHCMLGRSLNLIGAIIRLVLSSTCELIKWDTFIKSQLNYVMVVAWERAQVEWRDDGSLP